ncbi:MAG: transcriptional regulator [Burkholderiales bacterium PBB3]|nr:MAG: transcriptional regulator [Burkholderiales bacterium PBB3]
MQIREVKPGRPRGAKTFESAPAIAFGSTVRELRLGAGLSQEDLASRALVERSHMGKIERGEHLPNLVMILRIARALGCSSGYLLDQVEAKLT